MHNVLSCVVQSQPTKKALHAQTPRRKTGRSFPKITIEAPPTKNLSLTKITTEAPPTKSEKIKVWRT